jgi:hypothetical protein
LFDALAASCDDFDVTQIVPPHLEVIFKCSHNIGGILIKVSLMVTHTNDAYSM